MAARRIMCVTILYLDTTMLSDTERELQLLSTIILQFAHGYNSNLEQLGNMISSFLRSQFQFVVPWPGNLILPNVVKYLLKQEYWAVLLCHPDRPYIVKKIYLISLYVIQNKRRYGLMKLIV
uniref:Uncharacterized protein n=1 Tax=Panstrongylus lignarius TaxID=156445 RepID=A0A224Y176_9HEMI